MNTSSQTEERVAIVNATNNKPSNAKYNGKKAPMVNLKMLKTAKAVNGAISRIDTRFDWIKSRHGELLEDFKSDNSEKKRDAHTEATRLSLTLPGLREKKEQLEQLLPEINEKELSDLEGLEFPEMEF